MTLFLSSHGFLEGLLRSFSFENPAAVVASAEQQSCDMATRAH